jgi:2,5-diketo-D-gluconate reductase A
MEKVRLNTGAGMPILGFGVYQITDANVCRKSVVEALKVGYRSIDTAAAYNNEEAVGEAIRESGVPRDQIFVTTKIWVQDVSYDGAKKAFERSLSRLGLDRLDLYLIHQPLNDVYGAWRAMEELNDSGRVTSIGVSNFGTDRLADLIMFNKTIPSVDQVEMNPFCQRTDEQEYMASKGVTAESWASFAEGRNKLFENRVLNEIADSHGHSVGQTVLRWLIQRGVVCIPKSVHAERIRENFDVFDFKLSNEDMKSISSLDTGQSCFFDHRDPRMVEKLGNFKLNE